MKQPKVKSRKTCLNNHAQSISQHIMPLLIRGGYTDRHTYQCTNQSNFKKRGPHEIYIDTRTVHL